MSESMGRLVFRPEGNFVNCYIEDAPDQDGPIHIASVPGGFFGIPGIPDGFVGFCKFIVQQAHRFAGQPAPEFGDENFSVDPGARKQ